MSATVAYYINRWSQHLYKLSTPKRVESHRYARIHGKGTSVTFTCRTLDRSQNPSLLFYPCKELRNPSLKNFYCCWETSCHAHTGIIADPIPRQNIHKRNIYLSPSFIKCPPFSHLFKEPVYACECTCACMHVCVCSLLFMCACN